MVDLREKSGLDVGRACVRALVSERQCHTGTGSHTLGKVQRWICLTELECGLIDSRSSIVR